MALFDMMPFGHHHHHQPSLIDEFFPRRVMREFERAFRPFDEFFFRDRDMSALDMDPLFRDDSLFRLEDRNFGTHTFEEAQKLADEISHSDRPHLKPQKPKELLREPEELEELARRRERDRMHVEGTSYESSSITKDGKTVNVNRFSKLNPDGTVRTKVNEKLIDEEGHVESKTWRNKWKPHRQALGHEQSNKEMPRIRQEEKPRINAIKRERSIEGPRSA